MRLNDVFGITAKKLETYVERGADDDFKRCLQGRQHIVLHGSSKQGKTSLRKRYLNDNQAIAVSDHSDVRFVLVAIWIGKNKITARGDLAGRVVAVDADNWLDMDLREVIARGEKALNIEFPKSCKDEIIKVCGGSVFIVQDICNG